MSGWIKVHRKMAENGLWQDKPFSRGQAWIDLIMLASHKGGSFWKRGIEIKFKRGQVTTSKKGLAERWGWSRGKVDRFIEYLENKQMVEHQDGHQNCRVNTLITITKYDDYQDNEQQNGHQTDTFKNVKEVITYLNAVTGKNFKPSADSSKKYITARLREGYSMEDFKAAIDNQWQRWRGTDMEQYVRPKTLFNSDKFDGYVNNTKSGGKGYID